MSKQSARVGKAIAAALHNSICRRIRIANERLAMARGLEIVARSRSDVLSAVPKGLEDIYRDSEGIWFWLFACGFA